MITEGETMKINLDDQDSKIIKQNETYTLIDNTDLNGLIVSKTILHPEKSTTGHTATSRRPYYSYYQAMSTCNRYAYKRIYYHLSSRY